MLIVWFVPFVLGKMKVLHVFFSVVLFHKAFGTLSSWMGIDPIASLDVLEHLNYYACNLTGKISHKRNNVLFWGRVTDASGLVNNTKKFSWFWFINKIYEKSLYNIKDWWRYPALCLHNVKVHTVSCFAVCCLWGCYLAVDGVQQCVVWCLFFFFFFVFLFSSVVCFSSCSP